MTDLSVIMPIYNGAATLSRTLQSLGNGAGLEIIAVDQASTDDSRAILRQYSSKLPITILEAPTGSNWMANTNLGLAAATAPYATMLHQDDFWHKDRKAHIDRMIAAQPKAELWLHPADYVDEHDRRIGRLGPQFGRHDRLVSASEAFSKLAVQNTIPIPSAIFRTASAVAIGGLDETLWYTADWDFWLKLAARGPVAWSPAPMAAFRIHAGSQTVSGSRDISDFAAQLELPVLRHFGDQPRLARLARASNAVNVWLAARYHKTPLPLWPLITEILSLGPTGVIRLLRDSRILARLMPRLRLTNTSVRQARLSAHKTATG